MPTRDYTYAEVADLGELALEEKDFLGGYTEHVKRWIECVVQDQAKVPIDTGDNGTIEWISADQLSSTKLSRVYLYVVGTVKLGFQLRKETTDKQYTKVEVYAHRETPFSVATTFFQTIQILSNIHSNQISTATKQREKAIQAWGLDPHIQLSSNAALFYLLYTRMNRGDHVARAELRYLMDYLLPQLKNYLDMATAGEARYTLEGGRANYDSAFIPQDVRDYIATSKHLELRSVIWRSAHNHQLFLVDQKGDGRDVFAEYSASSNDNARMTMWAGWKDIREKYGLDAITWCVVRHFMGHGGGGGVSGPLWANAANLVRKHDLKQISDLFFIDQAFSLQHNGGNIFNKLWDCSNLQHILSCAFKGNMRSLPDFLNDEHKRIYKQVCVEIMFYEGRKKQGEVGRAQRARAPAAFSTSTVLNQ